MLLDQAKILVIDDEEVIRDTCTQTLAKDGIIVATAENGDKGLELFREFQPDLVLIDLKMPGKSGLEVLEEIESTDPDVVKVVITGYATVFYAVDAMKRGAYDFIPKPFTPEDIRIAVARGLEKRRLILENQALRREQERIRRNMISLVSHELRSPLSATVQYLEVILGGMAGQISEEAGEIADRCIVRLREMLELLHRWLSLATFDPARMGEDFKDVDLFELARESIEVLKPTAEGRKVSLTLKESHSSCCVKGCRVPLEEILNNLISNGIKYNREGGWVKVSLSNRKGEVWLEIQDNGIGIAETHLSRIFDEFYRVDGRRNAPVKGSGLGLSIVGKMVEAHGGRMQVESMFGEGSTFRAVFPAVSESGKLKG